MAEIQMERNAPPLKRLKEMCINTKYSMSIIEKAFKYQGKKISVIKCNDEIWFRGKRVVQSLGYSKPLKALHTHIDKEDK